MTLGITTSIPTSDGFIAIIGINETGWERRARAKIDDRVEIPPDFGRDIAHGRDVQDRHVDRRSDASPG